MGPPEGSPDTDPVAAWLIAAEIALGRRDPAWPGGVVSLLDTAFLEVGASGRVWDRASMAEVLSVAGPSTLQFDAFAVHSLGGAVALVTYRTIDPVRQPDEGATYAHKLGKEEGVLDWRRPAAELERKVRAFHPWPGTSFEAPKAGGTERIKVLAATLTLAGGPPGSVTIARDGFPVVTCGVGGLKLLMLQRPGKSAQAADAFLRGFSLEAGTVLAPPSVASLPT